MPCFRAYWQLPIGIYHGKAGPMMNKMTLLNLCGAFALAACTASPDNDQRADQGADMDRGSLEGARIGGAFTLTNQDGSKTSWSDFDGKYRLIYFGYSYCPDVCPVDLQRIAQGYSLFAKQSPERAARVQPIFVSLDPERDRPEVIKNYVSAFHPKLIGLTGTEEEIAATAKAFVVVYNKEQFAGASDYLVSHSRTPYLFGPKGEPIALVPVDDPGTPQEEGLPEEIAQALDRWVK